MYEVQFLPTIDIPIQGPIIRKETPKETVITPKREVTTIKPSCDPDQDPFRTRGAQAPCRRDREGHRTRLLDLHPLSINIRDKLGVGGGSTVMVRQRKKELIGILVCLLLKLVLFLLLFVDGGNTRRSTLERCFPPFVLGHEDHAHDLEDVSRLR